MSEIFEGGEFRVFAFFSEIRKFNSRKIHSKNPSYKTLPSYMIWAFLHISLNKNIFHVDFFISLVPEFPVTLDWFINCSNYSIFWYLRCEWYKLRDFRKKTTIFDSENQFLSFETFRIVIAKISSRKNFWH